MRLSWKNLGPRDGYIPIGYGRELMVFCDDKEIHAVREVDEEAGTVEYLLRNAEGKFYPQPDRTDAAFAILHGRVEIMLKPNASEGARRWFTQMRAEEEMIARLEPSACWRTVQRMLRDAVTQPEGIYESEIEWQAWRGSQRPGASFFVTVTQSLALLGSPVGLQIIDTLVLDLWQEVQTLLQKGDTRQDDAFYVKLYRGSEGVIVQLMGRVKEALTFC